MDIHKNARLTLIFREKPAKKVMEEGLTLKQAAACFNVSAKTAAKWVGRYEHQAPGDLPHLDIKKLGRIAKPGHRVTGNPAHRVRGVGWEYLHVAIDDHSRIAFSAIYPNEQAASTAHFLLAAMAYYPRLGIRFKAVLTDNGPAYRSRLLARTCQIHGLKHRFTSLHTTHQRQSRTLHPDCAQRIGLSQDLSELRGKKTRAAQVAPSVQLAPPSW
jgi:hypothetical protein